MNGMEMMLKSMGIDPVEMKQSIENFKQLASTVADVQKSIDAKLSIIVLNQGRIEGKIDELLSRGEDVVGKEVMAEHFAAAGAPILAEGEANDGVSGSD